MLYNPKVSGSNPTQSSFNPKNSVIIFSVKMKNIITPCGITPAGRMLVMQCWTVIRKKILPSAQELIGIQRDNRLPLDK